ncbi:MAG: hypothetical protein UX47_C0004G0056 [Candidatus Collierbacteria bacterium GW2011_GWA2_46_26]|uniref:Uncharacterized protein n=1 Tax=Candidatus Collierbacteria bacterium GW2011_GWA2_46_26 TaxID=1618381 RepID=A0A0G1PL00_9BACT|nr:MAG: hypothetical protein UX47_C0004G0056 [Candidatus Collierbacteria bacterium GW2011_GWA2_46_26]
MTVIFGIAGIPNYFTTDPAVVPDSRHLAEGDYVRLPDGRVYKLVSDYPTKFTSVPEEEIPSGVEILRAREYDSVSGRLLK